MMKPGRGLLLTLFFFLIIGIPFGGRAAERLTVTDLASRTVSVPLGPRRIICLGPGCLRLLCYLGAEGRLVGVEGFEKTSAIGRSYRYAKPSILGLPVIGPGGPAAINKEPDLEAVIGVKPDIIFITYMEPGKADALQQKLGVPVIVLSYGRIGIFGRSSISPCGSWGRSLIAKKGPMLSSPLSMSRERTWPTGHSHTTGQRNRAYTWEGSVFRGLTASKAPRRTMPPWSG